VLKNPKLKKLLCGSHNYGGANEPKYEPLHRGVASWVYIAGMAVMP